MDHVITIELLSTGSPALDFMIVSFAIFAVYWVVKAVWSLVVGG